MQCVVCSLLDVLNIAVVAHVMFDLLVVGDVMSAVFYVLFVVCCLLFVVCCLVFAGCWLL